MKVASILLLLSYLSSSGGDSAWELASPYLFGRDALEIPNGEVSTKLVGFEVRRRHGDASDVKSSVVRQKNGAEVWDLEEHIWLEVKSTRGTTMVITKRSGVTAAPPGSTSESLGTPQALLSFQGPVSQVNHALASLTYVCQDSRCPDTDEITIAVNGVSIGDPVPLKVTFPDSSSSIRMVIDSEASASAQVFDEDLNDNLLETPPFQVRFLDNEAQQQPRDIQVTFECSSGATLRFGENGSEAVFDSVESLNQALGQLRYSPPSEWSGRDLILATVKDIASGQETQVRFFINVKRVDDPPQLVLPSGLASVQGKPMFVLRNGDSLPAFPRVDDVDGGENPFQLLVVSLQVSHGRLTVLSPKGVVLDRAEEVNILSLKGYLTNVNRALETLVYTPPSSFAGEEELVGWVTSDTGYIGPDVKVTFNVEAMSLGPTLVQMGPDAPIFASVSEGSHANLCESFHLDLLIPDSIPPKQPAVLDFDTTCEGASFFVDTDLIPYGVKVTGINTPSVSLKGPLELLHTSLCLVSVQTSSNWNSALSGRLVTVKVTLDESDTNRLSLFFRVHPVNAAPVLHIRDEGELGVRVGIDSLPFPLTRVEDTDDGAALHQSQEIIHLSFAPVSEDQALCGTLSFLPQFAMLVKTSVRFQKNLNQHGIFEISGSLKALNSVLQYLVYRVEPDAVCVPSLQNPIWEEITISAWDAAGARAEPQTVRIKISPYLPPLFLHTAAQVFTFDGSKEESLALAPLFSLQVPEPRTLISTDGGTYTFWIKSMFGTLSLKKSVAPGIRTIVDEDSRSVVVTGKVYSSLNSTLQLLEYTPLQGWAGIDDLHLELRHLAQGSVSSAVVSSKDIELSVRAPPPLPSYSWAQRENIAKLVRRDPQIGWEIQAHFRGLVFHHPTPSSVVSFGIIGSSSSVSDLILQLSTQQSHGLRPVNSTHVKGTIHSINAAIENGLVWCAWLQEKRPVPGDISINLQLAVGNANEDLTFDLHIVKLLSPVPVQPYVILLDAIPAPFPHLLQTPFTVPFGQLGILPALSVSATPRESTIPIRVTLSCTQGLLLKQDSLPSTSVVLYEVPPKIAAQAAGISFQAMHVGVHVLNVTVAVPSTGETIRAFFRVYVPVASGRVELREEAFDVLPVIDVANLSPSRLFSTQDVVFGESARQVTVQVALPPDAVGSLTLPQLTGINLVESKRNRAILHGKVSAINNALKALSYLPTKEDPDQIQVIVSIVSPADMVQEKQLKVNIVGHQGFAESVKTSNLQGIAFTLSPNHEGQVVQRKQGETFRLADLGWMLDTLDMSSVDPASVPVYFNVSTTQGTLDITLVLNQEPSIQAMSAGDKSVSLLCTLAMVPSVFNSMQVVLPSNWNSDIAGEIVLLKLAFQGTKDSTLGDLVEIPVYVFSQKQFLTLAVDTNAQTREAFLPQVGAEEAVGLFSLSAIHVSFPEDESLLHQQQPQYDIHLECTVGAFYFPTQLIEEDEEEALTQSANNVTLRGLTSSKLALLLVKGFYYHGATTASNDELQVTIVDSPTGEQLASSSVTMQLVPLGATVTVSTPIHVLKMTQGSSGGIELHDVGLDSSSLTPHAAVKVTLRADYGRVSFDSAQGVSSTSAFECGSVERTLECNVAASALKDAFFQQLRPVYQPVADFFGPDFVTVEVRASGDRVFSGRIAVLVYPKDDPVQLQFVQKSSEEASHEMFSRETPRRTNVPLSLSDNDQVPKDSISIVVSVSPVDFGSLSVAPETAHLQTQGPTINSIVVSGSFFDVQAALLSLGITPFKPLRKDTSLITITAQVQEPRTEAVSLELHLRLPAENPAPLKVSFASNCSAHRPLMLSQGTTAQTLGASLVFTSWYEAPAVPVNLTMIAMFGTLSVLGHDEIDVASSITLQLESLESAEYWLSRIQYKPDENFHGEWFSSGTNVEELERIKAFASFLHPNAYVPTVASGECYISVAAIDPHRVSVDVESKAVGMASHERSKSLPHVSVAAKLPTHHAGLVNVEFEVYAQHGRVEIDTVRAQRLGVSHAYIGNSLRLKTADVFTLNLVLGNALSYHRQNSSWYGEDVVFGELQGTFTSSPHVLYQISAERPSISFWRGSTHPGFFFTPSADNAAVLGTTVDPDKLNTLDIELDEDEVNARQMMQSKATLQLSSQYGWLASTSPPGSVLNVRGLASYGVGPSVLYLEPNVDGSFSGNMHAVQRIKLRAQPTYQIHLISVIDTVEDTLPVAGWFTLAWDGEVTPQVSHSATEAEMETALATLGTIGAVNVTRTVSTASNRPESFEWRITLLDYRADGPTSKRLDVSEMSFSESTTTVLATMEQQADHVRGFFQLSFMGFRTNVIPHDASETLIQSELVALAPLSSSLNAVSVSAGSEIDEWGAKSWDVTFNFDGQVNLIEADGSALTGAATGVEVETVESGEEAAVWGTFALVLGSKRSQPLSASEFSAQDLLDALRSIGTSVVDGLDALRPLQIPDAAKDGWAWAIGADLSNVGMVPLSGSLLTFPDRLRILPSFKVFQAPNFPLANVNQVLKSLRLFYSSLPTGDVLPSLQLRMDVASSSYTGVLPLVVQQLSISSSGVPGVELAQLIPQDSFHYVDFYTPSRVQLVKQGDIAQSDAFSMFDLTLSVEKGMLRFPSSTLVAVLSGHESVVPATELYRQNPTLDATKPTSRIQVRGSLKQVEDVLTSLVYVPSLQSTAWQKVVPQVVAIRLEKRPDEALPKIWKLSTKLARGVLSGSFTLRLRTGIVETDGSISSETSEETASISHDATAEQMEQAFHNLPTWPDGSIAHVRRSQQPSLQGEYVWEITVFQLKQPGMQIRDSRQVTFLQVETNVLSGSATSLPSLSLDVVASGQQDSAEGEHESVHALVSCEPYAVSFHTSDTPSEITQQFQPTLVEVTQQSQREWQIAFFPAGVRPESPLRCTAYPPLFDVVVTENSQAVHAEDVRLDLSIVKVWPASGASVENLSTTLRITVDPTLSQMVNSPLLAFAEDTLTSTSTVLTNDMTEMSLHNRLRLVSPHSALPVRCTLEFANDAASWRVVPQDTFHASNVVAANEILERSVVYPRRKPLVGILEATCFFADFTHIKAKARLQIVHPAETAGERELLKQDWSFPEKIEVSSIDAVELIDVIGELRSMDMSHFVKLDVRAEFGFFLRHAKDTDSPSLVDLQILPGNNALSVVGATQAPLEDILAGVVYTPGSKHASEDTLTLWLNDIVLTRIPVQISTFHGTVFSASSCKNGCHFSIQEDSTFALSVMDVTTVADASKLCPSNRVELNIFTRTGKLSSSSSSVHQEDLRTKLRWESLTLGNQVDEAIRSALYTPPPHWNGVDEVLIAATCYEETVHGFSLSATLHVMPVADQPLLVSLKSQDGENTLSLDPESNLQGFFSISDPDTLYDPLCAGGLKKLLVLNISATVGTLQGHPDGASILAGDPWRGSRFLSLKGCKSSLQTFLDSLVYTKPPVSQSGVPATWPWFGKDRVVFSLGKAAPTMIEQASKASEQTLTVVAEPSFEELAPYIHRKQTDFQNLALGEVVVLSDVFEITSPPNLSALSVDSKIRCVLTTDLGEFRVLRPVSGISLDAFESQRIVVHAVSASALNQLLRAVTYIASISNGASLRQREADGTVLVSVQNVWKSGRESKLTSTETTFRTVVESHHMMPTISFQSAPSILLKDARSTWSVDLTAIRPPQLLAEDFKNEPFVLRLESSVGGRFRFSDYAPGVWLSLGSWSSDEGLSRVDLNGKLDAILAVFKGKQMVYRPRPNGEQVLSTFEPDTVTATLWLASNPSLSTKALVDVEPAKVGACPLEYIKLSDLSGKHVRNVKEGDAVPLEVVSTHQHHDPHALVRLQISQVATLFDRDVEGMFQVADAPAVSTFELVLEIDQLDSVLSNVRFLPQQFQNGWAHVHVSVSDASSWCSGHPSEAVSKDLYIHFAPVNQPPEINVVKSLVRVQFPPSEQVPSKRYSVLRNALSFSDPDDHDRFAMVYELSIESPKENPFTVQYDGELAISVKTEGHFKLRGTLADLNGALGELVLIRTKESSPGLGSISFVLDDLGNCCDGEEASLTASALLQVEFQAMSGVSQVGELIVGFEEAPSFQESSVLDLFGMRGLGSLSVRGAVSNEVSALHISCTTLDACALSLQASKIELETLHTSTELDQTTGELIIRSHGQGLTDLLALHSLRVSTVQQWCGWTDLQFRLVSRERVEQAFLVPLHVHCTDYQPVFDVPQHDDSTPLSLQGEEDQPLELPVFHIQDLTAARDGCNTFPQMVQVEFISLSGQGHFSLPGTQQIPNQVQGVQIRQSDSSSSWSVVGCSSAVNELLAASIVYHPEADMFGEETLRVRVSRLTAPESSKPAERILSIYIAPVNDPPRLLIDDVQKERHMLFVRETNAVALPKLRVQDVDAHPNERIQVSLQSDGGSFQTIGKDGKVSETHPGRNVQLQGTLDEVNAQLDTVLYVAQEGFVGMDTVVVQVSDGGENPQESRIDIVVSQTNQAPSVKALADNETGIWRSWDAKSGLSLHDLFILDDEDAFDTVVELDVTAKPNLFQPEVQTLQVSLFCLDPDQEQLASYDGSFRLKWQGRVTDPISFDVTEDILKEKLEDLDIIKLAIVDKTNAVHGRELSVQWSITFFNPSGDVPLLTAGDLQIDGPFSASISVQESQRGFGRPLIQRIKTSAPHRNMVQTVVTRADVGPLSGRFKLAMDLSFLGGTVAETEWIDFDAVGSTADEYLSHATGTNQGESMQSKLNKMLAQAAQGLENTFHGFHSTDLQVSVSKTKTICTRSCRNAISSAAPIPFCTLDQHCNLCIGFCTSVSGERQTTRCHSDLDCTGALCDFSAGECLTSGSACQIDAQCVAKDTCQSFNCREDDSGGSTWTVEFVNAPADLPMLFVPSGGDHLLAPSNPRITMDLEMDRTPPVPLQASNRVSGSFRIGKSQALPSDASGEDVTHALREIGYETIVQASLPDLESGKEWLIVFLGDAPPQEELLVDSKLLAGQGAQVTSEMITRQSSFSSSLQVRGSFGAELVHANPSVDTIWPSHISLLGRIADLNALLRTAGSLSFVPPPSWEGDVLVTVTVANRDGKEASAQTLVHSQALRPFPTLWLEKQLVQAVEDTPSRIFGSGRPPAVLGLYDSIAELRITAMHGRVRILFHQDLAFRTVFSDAQVEGSRAWISWGQTLSFEGSASELSTALLNLEYKPEEDFTGVDEITLEIGETILRTVLVQVKSVVDLPKVLADLESVHVMEDERVPIATQARIHIGDGDMEATHVELFVRCNFGSLSLNSAGPGVEVMTYKNGTLLRFRGSIRELNELALPAVFYEPRSDFFGTDSVTFLTVDGARSHGKTIQVHVSPTNDAPRLLSAAYMVDVLEDHALSLAQLVRFEDPDATLEVPNVKQVVRITAEHVKMQQAVRVSATTGPISGFFRLAVNLTALGGLYAESEWISHEAVAAVVDESKSLKPGSDIGESMEAKVNAMLAQASVGLETMFRDFEGPLRATVSRTNTICDLSCHVGVEPLPFEQFCSQGSHCEVCVGRCSDAVTQPCIEDSQCSNEATCSFGNGECLSSGSPCSEEGRGHCVGTGQCKEENCRNDPSGGYTWVITFENAPWSMPMLSIAERNLFATLGPRVEVDVVLDRHPALPVRESNTVGGSFMLAGLVFSSDVTAEEMQLALTHGFVSRAMGVVINPKGEFQTQRLGLESFPALTVNRSLPDLMGGFEWEIHFHSTLMADVFSSIFDTTALAVDFSGLTGQSVQAFTHMERTELLVGEGDGDFQPERFSLSLTVEHGELNLIGEEKEAGQSLQFSNITGPQVEFVLGRLMYQPALNWNTQKDKVFDFVHFRVSEDGDGETLETETKLVVNVIAVNDAPVIEMDGSELHPEENTMDLLSKRMVQPLVIEAHEGLVSLVDGVSVRDVDEDVEGKFQVKVSIVGINGTVSIGRINSLNQFAGYGQVSTDASSSSSPFYSSMSFKATLFDINHALKELYFLPSRTKGMNGTGALVISVNDQGNSGRSPTTTQGSDALTDTITIPVTVSGSLERPRIQVPSRAFHVKEDSSVVLQGLSISFPNVRDDDNKLLLTITAENGVVVMADSLQTLQGLEILERVGEENALVLKGPLQQMNIALGWLKYMPDLHFHTQFRAPETLRFSLTYMDWESVEATVAVHVSAQNDRPFIHVPGAKVEYEGSDVYRVVEIAPLTGREDEVMHLHGVSVEDVDHLPERGIETMLTVHVSCERGTVWLTRDSSLSAAVVSARTGAVVEFDESKRWMVLKGGLDRVNYALALLRYKGASNWNGLDSITIAADDLEGGVVQVSIPVLIEAVNDPPVWILPETAPEVMEDGSVVLGHIELRDVDVVDGSEMFSVHIVAKQGELAVVESPGEWLSVIQLDDTLNNINRRLERLQYRPSRNRNTLSQGPDEVHFVANDLGSHGAGGFRLGRDSLAVNRVVALDDAPRILVPGAKFANESSCEQVRGVRYPRSWHEASEFSQCGSIIEVERIVGKEDESISIEGISVQDTDLEDRILFVSLSVSHGSVSVGVGDTVATSQVAFTGGTHNSQGVVSMRCLQSVCNAVLSTVRYRSLPNWHGRDELVISVESGPADGRYPRSHGLKTTIGVPILIEQVNDIPRIVGGYLAMADGQVQVEEDETVLLDQMVQIYHPDQAQSSLDQRQVVVVLKARHGMLAVTKNRVQGEQERLDLEFLSDVEALFRPRHEPSRRYGTSVITFHAPVSTANMALATITYRSSRDWNSGLQEFDFVDIFVCDSSQFVSGDGEDGFQVDAPFDVLQVTERGAYSLVSIPVRVVPVDDVPTLLFGLQHSGAYAMKEDGAQIALDRVLLESADSTLIEINVGVEQGHLFLNHSLVLSETSVFVLQSGGQSESEVQFHATLDVAKQILLYGFVQFKPATNWFGSTTLVISAVSPSGRRGSLTIPIHVEPVNDAPEIHVGMSTGGYTTYETLEAGSFYFRSIPGAKTLLGKKKRTLELSSTSREEGFELWRTQGIRPKWKTGSWDEGTGKTLLGQPSWRFSEITKLGDGKARGSSPQSLAVFQNEVFFSADDGVHGRELWATQGTESSTRLVKDMYPGSRGSGPRHLHVHDDGKLYFAANGRDLSWMETSDECSGFRVVNVRNRSSDVVDDWIPVGFAVSRETTFQAFGSYDCPPGYHWASSEEVFQVFGAPGTEEEGGDGDQVIYTSECGWSGDDWAGQTRKKFRMADSSQSGAYVGTWKTTQSPALVDNSFFKSGVVDTTQFAGAVCFPNGGVHPVNLACLKHQHGVEGASFCYSEAGMELWVSDGTDAGTQRVVDVFAGSTGSNPEYLTSFQGSLFFAATSHDHGTELWRSDGTASGTVLVQDIAPGVRSSNPAWLTTSQDGSLLFFVAETKRFGRELWVSDGVASFTSGAQGVNGKASRLKDIDGSGTRLVADLVNGESGSDPRDLIPLVDGFIAFSAFDQVHGRQVWVSDGTAANTGRLTHLREGETGCMPEQLVVFDGKLFFSADDGVSGRELWSVGSSNTFVAQRSDGSTFLVGPGVEADGLPAQLVKDIVPGWLGSNPSLFTVFTPSDALDASDQVAQLFFFANDALWRSDGTSTGTQRAFQSTGKDVELNPWAFDNGQTRSMATLDGALLFSARRTLAPGMVDSDESSSSSSSSFPSKTLQAFMVEDSDAFDGEISFSLSCSKCRLFLEPAGVELLPTGLVSGNGTSLVELRGGIQDVNRALQSVKYEGLAGLHGKDVVNLQAEDSQGATTQKSVVVLLAPVNDPPVLTIPESIVVRDLVVSEDSLVDSTGTLVQVQVDDDCDEAYAVFGQGIAPVSLEVIISAQHGTLEVSGIDGTVLSATQGKEIRMVSTLEKLNRVLETLRYRGPCQAASQCGEWTEDVIDIYVNDNGNFGRGGAQFTRARIPVELQSF